MSVATAEQVELVWLFVRMLDRSCDCIEGAAEASAEGERMAKVVAMSKAKRFGEIANFLASEIRRSIPDFNFMQAEAWLERHKPCVTQ